MTPLGYRLVAAERRGVKIKKKLDIDPVEAEVVRLIFNLYLHGDGRSGALGVKGGRKVAHCPWMSHAKREDVWRRQCPQASYQYGLCRTLEIQSDLMATAQKEAG
jgi:hypothetical protein